MALQPASADDVCRKKSTIVEIVMALQPAGDFKISYKTSTIVEIVMALQPEIAKQ